MKRRLEKFEQQSKEAASVAAQASRPATTASSSIGGDVVVVNGFPQKTSGRHYHDIILCRTGRVFQMVGWEVRLPVSCRSRKTGAGGS